LRVMFEEPVAVGYPTIVSPGSFSRSSPSVDSFDPATIGQELKGLPGVGHQSDARVESRRCRPQHRTSHIRFIRIP
jgi:hypothetical protein